MKLRKTYMSNIDNKYGAVDTNYSIKGFPKKNWL